MSFTVNLTETPLRAGTFPAKVHSTREIKTKKGDPMVFVDWSLLDGPDVGRIVSQGIVFVPQMVSRNNHILRVLGQPHGADVQVDPDAWVGRLALVKIVLEAQGSQVVEITSVGTDAVPTQDEEIPF